MADRGTNALAKLGEIDARVLGGSACLWAWLGALFMGSFFVPFGQTGVMAEYAAWGVSLCGAPFCVLCLSRSDLMRRTLARRANLVAAAVVGVLGSAFLMLSAGTDSWLPLAFGSLLGGLYLADAIMIWGSVYCREGARTAVAYAAGGFACALVPDVLFSLLLAPYSAFAFSLLPALSMLLLSLVGGEWRAYAPARKAVPESGGKTLVGNSFVRIAHGLFGLSASTIASLMLVTIGGGYMNHAFAFSDAFGMKGGMAIQIARGAVAAALVVLAMLRPRRIAAAYRVGLLAIVAGFLLMPFLFGTSVYLTSGILIMAGYVAFDILIWVAVAQAAYIGSSDAFRSVCVMRLAINGVFYSVGGLLGMALSQLDMPGAFECADAILMGYLMTVAIVLLLGNRDLWDLLDARPHSPVLAGSAAALEGCLDGLARNWGLTSREREVFTHLAVGRTQPWIAERLGISDNTVNSHVRHIYAKSHVNSRQELLDLVVCAQSREVGDGREIARGSG